MIIPPLFITGTGRSGTWMLNNILSSHPEIHTFPREMRFIVDPDGLNDLVHALTDGFHPVNARESLYRFERLMRTFMATPERAPYKGFNLPQWLGEENYWSCLDHFCSKLVASEFHGKTWQLEPTQEGRLVSLARRISDMKSPVREVNASTAGLVPPRDYLKVVNYFSDRSELVSLAANFVQDIFSNAASIAGKTTWCEKTPQHLLILDFIWELFPESVVIHIKRDPRGVAQSLTKQFWAPSDLAGACYFLRSVYRRWRDLKSSIGLHSHRYLEFRLEDFALNPEPFLTQITELCGIEGKFESYPEVSIEKVDYWKTTMSPEEIRTVNELLGPEITFMGYSIEWDSV